MACVFAQPPEPTTRGSHPVSLARFPGETLVLGSARIHTRNGLAFYQRCEQIAGIVQTRFLWKRAYIITDPGAIGEVLVNHAKHLIKPYVLRRLKVLFGDGLLTTDGDLWMRRRHLIQPAFSSERMPAFVDVVRKNTEAMVSSWRDGEVRDLYPDLVDLCMKNVTETMLGVYDEELGSIVRALAATSHQLVRGVFDVIKPNPFRFRRSLRHQVEKQLDDLKRYLERLIEQRMVEPPRKDFLGLLLSGAGAHEPLLSRQAILAECVTLLLAGHETTASALVWSLYLLARHPQHAQMLASDLVRELWNEAPTCEQLEHLDSLRATLDEVLRLYPPTHRIARTITAPIVVGGHRLHSGADVVMPQWAVHRSPRWYRDPESFVPDRWTPSFRKSLPRFAYFPFSGGSRTCVGSQLAWCESAVILAVLAQRFQLTPCDKAPLLAREGLTLLPDSGRLRVQVERRRLAVGPRSVPQRPVFVD